jgi:GTP-binding protein EngB required for normal cell division
LLKVKTTRFGEIEVPENDVIHLPLGLIGFPELKKYVLLDHDKESPFKWFQALEDGAIAFVLIDPNIPPTKIDLEFINGLGEGNVPFALVFTKTDKMGKIAVQQSVERFLAALSETWETLPPHFVTSSEYRTGRPEMLEYIDGLLKRHKPPTKA